MRANEDETSDRKEKEGEASVEGAEVEREADRGLLTFRHGPSCHIPSERHRRGILLQVVQA